MHVKHICFVASAALLVASGCSGSTSVPATTVASTTAVATTTSTSTTLAATSTSATTAAATSTTARPAPTFALTGLAASNELERNRPALVVKIDNSSEVGVQPQVGLDQADVVFEEIIEGITRFAAVFQSRIPESVGPIRSARTSDIDIIAQLARPLLAWSGGNNGVVGAMQKADINDVGRETFNGANAIYFRSNERPAPHNLFAKPAEAYATLSGSQTPVAPLFSYRPAGAVETAGQAMPLTVNLKMDGTQVQYLWNGTAWGRSQYGYDHKSPSGTQIAPANVVVLVTEYRRSPADPNSPEAVTIGRGEAWVLTAGRLVKGTWNRPDAKKPAELRDEAGKLIVLTPGSTWVELPRSAADVTILG